MYLKARFALSDRDYPHEMKFWEAPCSELYALERQILSPALGYTCSTKKEKTSRWVVERTQGHLDCETLPWALSDGKCLQDWQSSLAFEMLRDSTVGTDIIGAQKKAQRNLRKPSGHRLGVPAGQTAIQWPASPGCPVVCYSQTGRKEHSCQDIGRVFQGHLALQRVVRSLMRFLLCGLAFLWFIEAPLSAILQSV